MTATRIWITSAIAFMVLLNLLLVAATGDLPESAIESISAEEMKPLLEFLAADEMQGRAINSVNNRTVARFLAYEFETSGIAPAGNDGTYFQDVPLLQAELGEQNILEISTSDDSKDAVFKEDFLPSQLSASEKAEGELLFAGYGISAAEYSYDDYAEISAEGKIVIIFGGQPEGKDKDGPFGKSSKYSAERYKIKNAEKHGAAGILLISDSSRLSNLSRAARFLYPEDSDRARFNIEPYIDQVSCPVVYVKPEFLESVLKGELNISEVKDSIGKTLRPLSLDFDKFKVTVQTDLNRKKTVIRNVLAKIEGSDPVLRNECVLISAHFDHIGTRGEMIFNGADDDASGTVSVLEIAEAFVEEGLTPRRTVLFALWDGEERGLLGSRYYTAAPAYPLDKTVALLQMDMVGRNQEITNPKDRRFGGLAEQSSEENSNTLHIIGFSKSSDLKNVIETANRTVSLDLLYQMDDHRLGLIRRSDHWPFLEQGVPAFLLTTGLHPDYHTANDTADKINYAKLERVAQLGFLTAWQLANSHTRPKMNE